MERVRVERSFEASAAAVFDAWSNPEVMRRWLAPEWSWETTVVEFDFRVGGAIEIVMHDPAGPEHRARGVYTEIDRPRRLAYSWTWERFGDAAPGLVEVDFLERDGRTHVTLTHTGLPSEDEARGHREGWGGSLENLARVLDGDDESGRTGPPVRRIIPYHQSPDVDATRAFYTGVLGLEEGSFGGGYIGFGSGAAQVVFAPPGADPELPDMGVDVGSAAAVDAAHAAARRAGSEIVYGPVDEPWGVRRFFVRDPQGLVISVLAHG